MPLSSQAKTARHRQRVNADPVAREEYLARRRESYQRRKQQGKIIYVKSDDMHQTERKKQREKWRAASQTYRKRKKMANAVLDITLPSMEDIPPVLGDFERTQELENANQAVTDPILTKQGFNPPTSSTPKKRKKAQKKYCATLQKQKHELKKQLTHLKKQMIKMKQLNDKFRKNVKRIMAKQKANVSEKFKPRGSKKLSTQRKQAVVNFLTRDENSRLLSGKRDTITKNKQKMQRRVLTKPLIELHAQYQTEVEPHLSLSYRQFLRKRPFFITEPKARDRDTCACMEHENINLLVSKLFKRGLLKTSSVSELLKMIVCDPKSKACMDRVCVKCCFDEIEFPDTDCTEISWEQWERVTSTTGEKTFANVLKKTYTGTIQDLKELFQKKLEALAIHQFNWVHQTEQFRDLKQNLTESEAVLHIDFSENYSCKMSTEIQSYHFGGSRKQATIHTAVLYKAHSTRSYATVSNSLRHDERAVWAHLEPILKELRVTSPQITVLHIISDGPVTQYRNKSNFYLLSTVPFLTGFKHVTWNYSEKCHGKGAPDGIGGAVKRDADLYVRRGGELQTPLDLYGMLAKKSGSNITYHWINDESIQKYDELIPENLTAVKGTLKIHQVLSSCAAQISHREVSCFCKHAVMKTCLCYQPVKVNLRETMCFIEPAPSSPEPSKEQASLQDLSGKFVIVSYDEVPYVGQVLQDVGEEVQVSTMQQSDGKNMFTWPRTPDVIFYYKKDVHAVISEPEPATSRSSRLNIQDWERFTNA